MNRLREVREEKKLDNKGFSLVELIIVIAIMAVLIGVLAPQYLKYVEKSRIATDKDNAVAIAGALQVYAADPDATTAIAGDEVVTITGTNTQLAGTATSAALQAAGMNVTNTKLANKQTFDKVEIKVTLDSNNNVQVTTTYSKGGTTVTP